MAIERLSTPKQIMGFEIPNFGFDKAFKVVLTGRERPVLISKAVKDALDAKAESTGAPTYKYLYETEVGYIAYQGKEYFLELQQYYERP